MTKRYHLTMVLCFMLSLAFAQTHTFNYSGSIVKWAVPPGVTSIKIEAWGAQGGNETWNPFYVGGLGAYMSGDFAVSPGDTLRILVGQRGETDASGGGGGGSFVATYANSPLLVAGGGGGASTDANGVGGVTGTAGTMDSENLIAGGTLGNGGTACQSGSNNGGAGGGFFTDGQDARPSGVINGGYGGKAFVNGGDGGIPGRGDNACFADAYGGFGGGGSSTCNTVGGGGGGGYSGGAGGPFFSCGATTPPRAGGGGGGSFNAGTNQTNTAATNSGDGKVVITELVSAPPCALTGSIKANGLKPFWGLPNPNVFYYGVGQWKKLTVNHSGGVGPYTYNWSITGPGTLKNQAGKSIWLFEPTGPVMVSVTIDDLGAGCQITENINIGWDNQYFCGTMTPKTWYLTVCEDGVTKCVSWGMAKTLIKGGNATIGACNIPTKTSASPLAASIYPNPTRDQATIQYQLDDPSGVMQNAEGTLEVLDVNGRIIYAAEIQLNAGVQYQNIDLSDMPAGLYVVRINSDLDVYTEKLQVIK